MVDLIDLAKRHRARLAELQARGRALQEADRRAVEDVRAIRERLARVEAQQDDAMRSEQFEVADSLNGTIESLRSALSSAEAVRRKIASDRTALEAEQTEVFNEGLAATTETFMGLKRYSDDREAALSSFRRDATARHNSTRDRLATEEEQLRLKEEHVALDTKLVEEETQQVERAISDQTNELDSQVTEMRARHARLVTEVAELERLLEEKRREGAWRTWRSREAPPPRWDLVSVSHSPSPSLPQSAPPPPSSVTRSRVLSRSAPSSTSS